MCAINGVSENNYEKVERMNFATKHRGPDGTSVARLGDVTFGHNRLAVIDLEKRSDQPMTSTDGRYTIVYNGELYNFKDIKAELAGRYRFVTESDTEVLLAAYAIWGEVMLGKLNGMFAFAIFDSHEKSIFLARDPVGIKPLYYSFKGGLTFSSELKGMAAAGFAELDHEMVAVFIGMQYVPSPRTFLQDVNKLQPGQSLKYNSDGSHEIRSYKVAFFEKIAGPQIQSTYEVIDDAVNRQLISDRRVGLFLSGGLDSSIVLHHARKFVPGIETFSLDFALKDDTPENQAKFNFDAATAALTANHYQVSHTVFTLTPEEVAGEMENAFVQLDEPVANPTSLSKYFLSQKVREAGVVVALGGDGGDEVFKGYPRYRIAIAAEYFQRLPAFLQQALAFADKRFLKLIQPLGPSYHGRQVYNRPELITRLCKLGDASPTVTGLFEERYTQLAENLKGADAFMAVDAFTWLPDESLHSTDRASMAHALEYRVPLLDLQVIKHSQIFGRSQHISMFKSKAQLQSEYRNKLPAHLFNKKKIGWLSPAAKWLRNELVEEKVLSIMSDQYSNKLQGIVDWSAVHDLLREHQDGKVYATNPIWNLIQLQVWASNLLDN